MIDERVRTYARLMGSVRIRGCADDPLIFGPSDHARSGSNPRNGLQSPTSGHTLPFKRTHRTTARKGRYGVRLSRPQGRLARPCIFVV